MHSPQKPKGMFFVWVQGIDHIHHEPTNNILIDIMDLHKKTIVPKIMLIIILINKHTFMDKKTDGQKK